LERSFRLDAAKARCTTGHRWRSFMAELRQEFDSFYVVEDGKELVTVGAVKKEFDRVVQKVASFISENEIQESFVPMEEGVVDLLEMYGRKKVEAIRSELMKYKVGPEFYNVYIGVSALFIFSFLFIVLHFVVIKVLYI